MDPFQEFKEYLAHVSSPAKSLPIVEAALQDARPIARGGSQDCFDKQESPDGTPWPKLVFDRPGGSEDDKPLLDQGRLRASIISKVEGSAITVETNRIGAGVQNYGATIVPVNVKWLTIPMTLEAKRVGGAKNFSGKLHFVRVDRGFFLKDDDGTLQYALAKKVTIPKREFLGFSDETQGDILEMVFDRFVKGDAERNADAGGGAA